VIGRQQITKVVKSQVTVAVRDAAELPCSSRVVVWCSSCICICICIRIGIRILTTLADSAWPVPVCAGAAAAAGQRGPLRNERPGQQGTGILRLDEQPYQYSTSSSSSSSSSSGRQPVLEKRHVLGERTGGEKDRETERE